MIEVGEFGLVRALCFAKIVRDASIFQLRERGAIAHADTAADARCIWLLRRH